ncbi:hypothetical protein M413DRAFT_441040 [Hebeloma cylindrosporum]|uniref:Uncharacterized protein n=1 Tax=Hebeloma cylindrosporum TaxID=76867 RepID=A0A0C2Y7Z4_HEBCY|nr:hypothetical protein M413DRAFT_441040 [Hebeloma cylindrosporum h7]
MGYEGFECVPWASSLGNLLEVASDAIPRVVFTLPDATWLYKVSLVTALQRMLAHLSMGQPWAMRHGDHVKK